MIRDLNGAAVQAGSDEVLADTLLELEQAAVARAERDDSRQTSTGPRLRWFGFTLLALLGVPLANAVLLDNWSWSAFVIYAVATQLYALLSWLLLKRQGHNLVRLSDLFLTLDIVFLFAAVHLTGGSNSWLFWVPLVHVAGQIPTGYRRVAWFSIGVVVGYLMLLALYAILDQPIDWTAGLARTLMLAGAALYICLSARSAQNSRLTRLYALQFARELLVKLNQKAGQLEQQRERVEQASRSEREFLSRVSQELRRPATTVLGFAQLLESAEPNRRQYEYVQRIVSAGRDLGLLIDEVMDLAELRTGHTAFRLEPVDLDAVLVEVLAALGPVAADRDVRLTRMTANSGSLAVVADRRVLRRVLLNVIWHALRSSAQKDEVSIRTESAGQRVRVYVRDSGPGLPPQPVRDLLSYNFANEADLARMHELGLGLAFANALTLKLDGRMGAETTVGSGTILWIELPLGLGITETMTVAH